MKKLIAVLLVVLLACSVLTVHADEAKNTRVALIMQQGGLGDEGFNDSAYAGLKICEEKFGITFNAVECTDTTQGETLVRELAEDGYGLIISLEAGISASIYTCALDYPDIYFCVIGRQLTFNPVDGFTETPANLVESYFTLNEHSFLAGVVAAFIATDGNEIIEGRGAQPGCNIGELFGAESIGFYQYNDGFVQGVKFFNPDANVYTDYTVGFSDTANAQTIAENMIKNMGCDVIWTCCGTAGLGGLQACRLNNVFGIGTDTNQDRVEEGYILTSTVRNNESLMQYYVEAYLNGTIKKDTYDLFDLTAGAVDITDMSVIEQYVTNPEKFAELKDLIAQVRAWVADGSITIFDARYASVYEGGIRLDDWMANSGKFVTYAELAAK